MPFQRLLELATASGGILFVMPLLLLVVFTVSFERTWYLGRMIACGRRMISYLAPLDRLDRVAIRAEVETLRGGPVTRLVNVALAAPVDCDREALQHRLDETIMREVPGIDRSLWMLDTAVTLAPLLGLLGTIIGMFNAFQVLGKPGSPPAEITGGVAEALIATAAGLLIAIIGIIFFNGLQTRVRLQVHELETLKTMLANRMATSGIGEQMTTLRLLDTAEE